MSLLENFYSVADFNREGQRVSASISINKLHPVFRGHFPNQPVTPGVCMMQIIKELAEKWANCALVLKNAKHVKFMAIINPESHPNIQVDLDVEETDGVLSVRSTTSYDDTIALKFNGIFQRVEA